MYCPKCAQPLAVSEIQFCSRCGLALNGLREIVAGKSQSKAKPSKRDKNELSLRQKGSRQGVTLMLLSMILIPAYVLLAALFPANDRLVESAVSDTPFEKISQTILVTMFLAGLVRTAYAWFFQESAPRSLPQLVSTLELPLDHSRPRDGFGAWRARTGELVESRDSGRL
jgi:hypothetical protein